MRCFGERAASGWLGWLKLDKGGNPAFGVQPARQNALCEGVGAVLSGCHGAFDSPLRGLRLPNRPGLPGVISALMRHVRAPASWCCPSKRAPALTSCLDRLLEGVCFCPSLPAPRADGRLSTESLVSSQPHGPLPQGASDFACFYFCGTRHGAGGCRPCGPGLYSSSKLWPLRWSGSAF